MKCTCPAGVHRRDEWRFLYHKPRWQYKKKTGRGYDSKFTTINCLSCKSVWKTKAAYVDKIRYPNVPF